MMQVSNLHHARVVVYGTRSCSDCLLAHRVLQDMRIEYLFVDIDEHHNAVETVRKLTGGRMKVPTILLPGYGVLVEPGKVELEQAVTNWLSALPDHDPPDC